MIWQCSCQSEVQQILAQGHWPAACTAELRAHVQQCKRCSEEVLVANHLRLARIETMEIARMEPPSLLWWRAQLRRRDAAIQQIARPLAAAQIFALALALAAIAGAVAAKWHTLVSVIQTTEWTPRSSLATMLGDWGFVPLVMAFGTLALLFGVVVYLTAERR